jgi:hypothetical protein
MPGAGKNNTSGCTLPSPSGVPAPVSDDVFGEAEDIGEVIYEVGDPVPDQTYQCFYTDGCHLECDLGRLRIRPGGADDISGSMPGDPCDSPPSASRPSIFSNFISDIRKLFYRPEAQ